METRRHFPSRRDARGILACCIALLALTSCVSGNHVRTGTGPAAPIHSLVFLNGEDAHHGVSEEYLGLHGPTDLQIRYSEFDPSQRLGGGIVLRTLQHVANVAGSSEDGTVQGIVDHYSDRLDDIERRYQKVEDFAADLGIDRSQFRQGLGITTAAAMTTLGTLYALKPVAQTDELMGTKLRAGYDISQLDDPRVTVSYNDTMRVLVSRDGIGGSLGTSYGLNYSADLNVRSLMASANLSYHNALTLGAVYAHKSEEVKGYVRLDF